MSRRGCSRRPSATATALGTAAPSEIPARSTQKAPSGNRRPDRAPTACARRVLPEPPVPVRVRSRVPRIRPAISASSRRRPISGVSGAGSLCTRQRRRLDAPLDFAVDPETRDLLIVPALSETRFLSAVGLRLDQSPYPEGLAEMHVVVSDDLPVQEPRLRSLQPEVADRPGLVDERPLA